MDPFLYLYSMSNKVVELFAGVGGFHLAAKKSGWEVIWANEWFPDTIVQHAYDCYQKRFPNTRCINEDIAKVIDQVPNHDLLVGGFPCQDYSVANTSPPLVVGTPQGAPNCPLE